MELFKAVPYGKRAVLVAKQNNVAELFDKARLRAAERLPGSSDFRVFVSF